MKALFPIGRHSVVMMSWVEVASISWKLPMVLLIAGRPLAALLE